jgi:hypothetical protein
MPTPKNKKDRPNCLFYSYTYTEVLLCGIELVNTPIQKLYSFDSFRENSIDSVDS